MSRVPGSHTELTWRTALSCNGGTCVRIAASERTILIGDSKNPDGPIISCTSGEWQDFVLGVKRGDFDDLL